MEAARFGQLGLINYCYKYLDKNPALTLSINFLP